MITCPKCGRKWDDATASCHRCQAPLQPGAASRPGLFARLRQWLGGLANVKVTTTVTTRTVVARPDGAAPSASPDPARAAIEALPSEAREAVAKALREAGNNVAVRVNVTHTNGPIRVVENREVRTYASPDEMPPELRARFEEARKGLLARPGASTRITVTVNGEKRTSNSLDELPPDLRASIERAHRSAEDSCG